MDKDKTQKENDAHQLAPPAPSTEKKSQTGVKKTNNHCKGFAGILSGICVFLTILTISLGAWLYQRMDAAFADVKQGVSNAQDEMRSLGKKTEHSLAQIDDFVKENTAEQTKLAKRYADIEKIQEQLSHLSGKEDWVLSEAYYLIQNADMQLAINQDINTARTQLLLAEYKISTLAATPALNDLRTVLLADIAKLETAPILDKHGIWAKLNAQETLFHRLKFKALMDESTVQVSEQTTSDVDDSLNWSSVLKNVWQEFSDLIRVSRYDQEVMQPVLTELEQKQVVRVLALLTEEAKWAVLKEDTIVYQESLNKMALLVKSHFEPTSSREALLASIDTLSTFSLQNKMPDISDSLMTIQAAIQRSSSLQRKHETPS